MTSFIAILSPRDLPSTLSKSYKFVVSRPKSSQRGNLAKFLWINNDLCYQKRKRDATLSFRCVFDVLFFFFWVSTYDRSENHDMWSANQRNRKSEREIANWNIWDWVAGLRKFGISVKREITLTDCMEFFNLMQTASWNPISKSKSQSVPGFTIISSHFFIFYYASKSSFNFFFFFIGWSEYVLVHIDRAWKTSLGSTLLLSLLDDSCHGNLCKVTLFLQLQIPIKRITIMWTACRKLFPTPGQRHSTKICLSTGSKRRLTRLVWWLLHKKTTVAFCQSMS